MPLDGATDPTAGLAGQANRTYRYLTFDVPVTYSFGFGLSGWGSGVFSYGDAEISPAGPIKIEPDMAVAVSFSVTNNGNVTCDEVAQLYLRTEATSGPQTPRPELKAFTRLHAIKPGESRATTLTLGWRELSVLRRGDLERVVEASPRAVFVGGGQPHEFVGGVSAKFATAL